MVIVEARVLDATHLELAKPIPAPAGGTLLISVAEPGDQAEEGTDWLALSAASLAEAYSADEPEYPAERVREQNPEYRP